MAHEDAGWQQVTREDVRETLVPPQPSDHKYSRGVVLLATGSLTFPGAAVLTAQAAGHAGAGMLRYTGPERVASAVLEVRPEAVHGFGRSNSLVIGSGIPDLREDERASLLKHLKLPTVVDAGGLTAFEPGRESTVITPHAGELSALLERLEIAKLDREEVESKPADAARLASRVLGCTVLLKGHTTHVAAHGESLFRVTAPTSWLATAGTGDVLAGILGATLAARHARGEPADLARDAAAAAWLHGRAGWLASQRNAGLAPTLDQLRASDAALARAPIGGPVLASHVAEALPAVIAAVLAK